MKRLLLAMLAKRRADRSLRRSLRAHEKAYRAQALAQAAHENYIHLQTESEKLVKGLFDRYEVENHSEILKPVK